MALDTHLYRRGATYYWRRTLPACPRFSKAGGADLRISLRTQVLAPARQRARRLGVATDAVLDLLSDAMQAGLVDTERLRALLAPILRAELERAEVARALGGERGPDEVARRVEAEHAAVSGIQDAIRHNRLDLARDVLARAAADGLDIPETGTDEHTVLARLVLRGLPAVHRINAQREAGAYDDDSADWLPGPSGGTIGGTPAARSLAVTENPVASAPRATASATVSDRTAASRPHAPQPPLSPLPLAAMDLPAGPHQSLQAPSRDRVSDAVHPRPGSITRLLPRWNGR
ncbi:DUF6538 domain-containing protein [Skermanella pratensis]|uniref:DUF6538 domain-containing protein n=1 Tax=Skermanella pratensis TaxID=2233999 RepID=UPI001300D805|nr:DUF6538 domain-containing protein [Skermanella pratensis]